MTPQESRRPHGGDDQADEATASVPQATAKTRKAEARNAGYELGVLLGLEDTLIDATDPYGQEPSAATIAGWLAEGRKLVGAVS